MKIKNAYQKLMSTIHANTLHGMSQAIAPVVYHALVHGQVRIKDLNALRNLQDPSLKKIKVAIGKNMPITWNKEKNTYVFSKVKRKSLQLKLDCVSVPTLAESILENMKPKQQAQDGTQEVKAWGEAQVQTQVRRINSMNVDELQKQIEAMQSLVATAKNKQRELLTGTFLKVVGE